MLGKSREVGVLRRCAKNRRIARGDGASPVAFESTGNDRSPAASRSRANLLIDEVDELLRKAYRDLLAHPIMVAKRYRDVDPAASETGAFLGCVGEHPA